MGPWIYRILCTYWNRILIVDHAGGYYGADFKGFHGVTQGDPLSLIIFNVVVNSVVRHWILLVSVCTRVQYGGVCGGATLRCLFIRG